MPDLVANESIGIGRLGRRAIESHSPLQLDTLLGRPDALVFPVADPPIRTLPREIAHRNAVRGLAECLARDWILAYVLQSDAPIRKRCIPLLNADLDEILPAA